jgi:hypothetical protein
LFTDFWISWAHTDPAYCKFGFTLCVNWTILAGSSPGAAFVDVDLHVVVLQSPGQQSVSSQLGVMALPLEMVQETTTLPPSFSSRLLIPGMRQKHQPKQ